MNKQELRASGVEAGAGTEQAQADKKVHGLAGFFGWFLLGNLWLGVMLAFYTFLSFNSTEAVMYYVLAFMVIFWPSTLLVLGFTFAKKRFWLFRGILGAVGVNTAVMCFVGFAVLSSAFLEKWFTLLLPFPLGLLGFVSFN